VERKPVNRVKITTTQRNQQRESRSKSCFLIVDKLVILQSLVHVQREIRSVKTAARLVILLECVSMAVVVALPQ